MVFLSRSDPVDLMLLIYFWMLFVLGIVTLHIFVGKIFPDAL